MSDYASLGVSIITLLFGVLWGAWMRILVARTFKGLDDAIAEIKAAQKSQSARLHDLEDFKIRSEESLKLLEDVKCYKDDLRAQEKEFDSKLSEYQRKADFIREMDQASALIEATGDKIDALDGKFERLRDVVYGANKDR